MKCIFCTLYRYDKMLIRIEGLCSEILKVRKVSINIIYFVITRKFVLSRLALQCHQEIQ